MRRLATLVLTLSLWGCTKSSEVSRQHARAHVEFLAKAATADVEEVRRGLPLGAKQLEAFFAGEKPGEDAAEAKEALERARGRVQDLRVSKGTFFLVAQADGRILRSDQQHDALADKNLFAGFEALKMASTGKYVEAHGSIPEAAGVKGRPDAQWAAAISVPPEPHNAGDVRGVYATGWSWSSYAYRLENQLRSSLRSALAQRESEPLVYVYVMVGREVYGAPVSPEVTAKTIKQSEVLRRAGESALVDEAREIEGRDFGLALKRVPALGPGVGIVVVRSET
jgi:hypothetical protein